MNTQEDSAPSGRPGALNAIDRFFGRLNAGLGFIVAVSLALFAVSISADLAMRRLGLGNMPWLYEVIEYALYAGVFLATPWVLREGAHVRVDLLLSAVPKGVAVRLEQLLDAIGALVSLALCYYGWRAGFEAWLYDSRQYKTLIIEDWWMMAIFSVSLLLLAIEFLFRLRRAGEVLEREEDPTGKTGF